MLSLKEEPSGPGGRGGHSGTTIRVPNPRVEDETSGGREGMWGELQARFGGSPFLGENTCGRKAGMGEWGPGALGGTVGPRRGARRNHTLPYIP